MNLSLRFPINSSRSFKALSVNFWILPSEFTAPENSEISQRKWYTYSGLFDPCLKESGFNYNTSGL